MTPNQPTTTEDARQDEGVGHTPGPWFIYDNRELNGALWIGTEPFETHAEVRFGCDEAEEKGDLFANARLIAAAPDLLAFAIAVDKQWTGAEPAGPDSPLCYFRDETRQLWRECRAAIAKATRAEPHS